MALQGVRMFNIGEAIYDFFGPLGVPGMLLCIFLLFYIDAIIFPTVPELFTVIIFMAYPQTWFAVLILATIALAEFLGLSTLYMLITRINVPQRIRKAVNGYANFLIYNDERMILVNRFAPVLPFMGAFVSICGWSFKKSAVYTLISGVLKYGIILALSNIFFIFFSEGTASLVTLVMVFVILGISLAVTYVKKRALKKSETDHIPPEGKEVSSDENRSA